MLAVGEELEQVARRPGHRNVSELVEHRVAAAAKGWRLGLRNWERTSLGYGVPSWHPCPGDDAEDAHRLGRLA